MKTRRFFTIALAIALFFSAASYRAQAQNQSGAVTNASAMTLTASTTGARVRFTTPSTVVQIRLEVYSATGRKVFDNELRGGNVLDWHLHDGQAEPLADGAYLCVVTVKSLLGKLTQTIASLLVEKSIATIHATNASQMTPQQAETIGPLEENPALTVIKAEEHPATTVVAHNGEEGQIIRGQGALSFRLGDFFSGKDSEQMRLTAEGNLGIGISQPQARLDVDGFVRATQGIVFPDGSVQFSASSKTFGPLSLRPGQFQKKFAPGQEHLSPNIGGTGTTGRIPKWIDGANGILGDSLITEANGNIGIGTPSPQSGLDYRSGSAALFTRDLPTNPGTAQSAMQLGVSNVGSRNPGVGPSFLFHGENSAGAKSFLGRVSGVWENPTAGAEAGAIFFQVRANSADVNALTERMRITSSGNVGIGVTNPIARLAVSTPTVDGGNNTAYFQAPNIGPHASNIHFGTTGDWYIRSAAAAGKVILQDTGGRVGIGTSSPTTAKLHVFDNSIGAAVYGTSALSGGGFNLGGIGVLGDTQAADGVGVYGRNPFGGFAMFADGNTSQARNKGGWVKALLKVSAGGIERCYNGITGSAGGTCGFTIGFNGFALFDINFGFRVDDRFATVTADAAGEFGSFGEIIYGFGNQNTIRVITRSGGGSFTSANFTIIVY
jgi:hypothetical protein